MKGIILAGGSGTRLAPLNKTTSKCLLPIAGFPMIYYPLNVLMQSGIDEILVILAKEHSGLIINYLGSGEDFGCEISYRVQQVPTGIASALLLAESFIGNDPFTLILNDNIFAPDNDVVNGIKTFQGSSDDFMLFSKKVSDPERFGVVIFSEDGCIQDIIEKPVNPPSDQAIVGVYCYRSPQYVFDAIRSLSPSARGEYEISDLNQILAKNTKGIVTSLSCEWIDAGTHVSFQKANEIIWKTRIPE